MLPLTAVYQTIYVQEEGNQIDFQCSSKFKNPPIRDFSHYLI